MAPVTEPFTAGPLDGDRRSQVAVIGGGFTGLSAALHLAEFGVEVVLLEAEAIGFGASGRNGGQVNPGLKLDESSLRIKFGAEVGTAFHQMGQQAPAFLGELIERLGLRCDFERPGLVRLAHNRAAAAPLWAAADLLERAGVEVERLPDADAVDRIVGTKRYFGGFIDPRGASVRPLDLAWELARAAQRAGVQIHAGSRATALVPDGEGWRVVTPTGAVRARDVVVATNGYTNGLIPGLAASLLPVNSFQIATAPLAPALASQILPGRHTVYDSRRLVLYFRRTSDDRVVLGGRASFSSAKDPSGARPDYSVLERVLAGIFPALAGVPIDYRWTGLVCITPDHLPHYHAPQRGLHIALGFNGRGVAMSVRTGAWLANKLARKSDAASIPVTPIIQVPFHRWREPMLNLAMRWQHLLDTVGR